MWRSSELKLFWLLPEFQTFGKYCKTVSDLKSWTPHFLRWFIQPFRRLSCSQQTLTQLTLRLLTQHIHIHSLHLPEKKINWIPDFLFYDSFHGRFYLPSKRSTSLLSWRQMNERVRDTAFLNVYGWNVSMNASANHLLKVVVLGWVVSTAASKVIKL